MDTLGHMILLGGIGAILSFIGSVPFGIINVSVAETTVRKGFRAGAWMGLGAASVEFFQAFISLMLIDLFIENTHLEQIFHFIALCIFFALAAFYFVKARKDAKASGYQVSNLPDLPNFLRGMLVCALNVMFFPYWIFFGTYLSSNGWMELNYTQILIFAGGTMIGTFGILLLYAYLGILLLRRASQVKPYMNWFLAFLFLGLGIYQAFKSF